MSCISISGFLSSCQNLKKSLQQIIRYKVTLFWGQIEIRIFHLAQTIFFFLVGIHICHFFVLTVLCHQPKFQKHSLTKMQERKVSGPIWDKRDPIGPNWNFWENLIHINSFYLRCLIIMRCFQAQI